MILSQCPRHTGDRLLDTKVNLIGYLKRGQGTVFQPRVLQFNLDNIIDFPTANSPTKNVECAGAENEPMTFKADAQTIRPSDPMYIPQCN